MASSCWRPSARTSIRLATLAQAMKSTTPMVAIKTHNTLADVADDIVFERPYAGPEARFLGHFETDAGGHGEFFEHEGEHARDIGICLRQGGAGFEARDGLEAEIPDECFGAVELQGLDQGGGGIHEAEVRRHDADDLGGFAVDQDAPPDGGCLAAELALPVAVGEDHGLGAAGRIVFAGEPTAANGLHAKDGKNAVGYVESVDLLGLAGARDVDGIVVPNTNVLEGRGPPRGR